MSFASLVNASMSKSGICSTISFKLENMAKKIKPVVFVLLLTLEHIKHSIEPMTIENIKPHNFEQLVDKVHNDGYEICNEAKYAESVFEPLSHVFVLF